MKSSSAPPGIWARAATLARSAGRSVVRAFGYAAAEAGDRQRKHATAVLRHEDGELTPKQRVQLVANSRDLQRNYAVARWMLAQHCNYVSTFNFQSRTGDKALDRRIEQLVADWSEAESCDVGGRHSLPDLIRLAEARRTVDGDCGILFLKSGQLQPIEGDRIRTPPGEAPPGTTPADWSHGVRTDAAGRALQYCICRRARVSDTSPAAQGWQFERVLSADHLHLHAYWDRFDQTRGVSPFAAALNSLRDVAEGHAYSLAKMKVSQLFGLAIFRDSGDTLGTLTTDDDDAGAVSVDFGRGPFQLDLDAKDKAEFLESKSPSVEFQQWMQTSLQIALKALDLPFSFFAENYTNFSGARQAWIQYEWSARAKRRANRALLNKIMRWRLGLWMDAGVLPEMDLAATPWKWLAAGVPWIDPLTEVQADVTAIAASLTSRSRVLHEQGESWEEVIEELAAEQAALEALGLNASISPNTPTPQITPTADPAPSNTAPGKSSNAA